MRDYEKGVDDVRDQGGYSDITRKQELLKIPLDYPDRCVLTRRWFV
jgi:hypothetical protein